MTGTFRRGKTSGFIRRESTKTGRQQRRRGGVGWSHVSIRGTEGPQEEKRKSDDNG